MDVSIFIRSLNEEALIGRCLTALSLQKSKLNYEIVLLDCSSQDRTVEIARSFGVTIYSIPRNLFTYASALNAGTQLCNGTFFVPLSAHAVPTTVAWLENLTAPLVSSANVCASFSRQIAWDDASTAEKQNIEQEFGTAAWQRDKANFQQLLNENMEPYKLLAFSNVSSCIRRDFLLTHPFYELPFCEDRAFALDVLSAGSSFAYTPESVVHHSHYPSFTANLSIAERATVSRAAINREAARRFGIQNQDLFMPPARKLLMKVPATFAYGAAKSIQALISRNEQSRARSVVYFASLGGITLGKLRAVKDIEADGPLALKRSDPAKLLLQARKERPR